MNTLKRIWEGWKRVAKKIGDFQARIILAVFYFVILAPFSLLVRASDPLTIGNKTPKGWHAKKLDPADPKAKAIRQW